MNSLKWWNGFFFMNLFMALYDNRTNGGSDIAAVLFVVGLILFALPYED